MRGALERTRVAQQARVLARDLRLELVPLVDRPREEVANKQTEGAEMGLVEPHEASLVSRETSPAMTGEGFAPPQEAY